MKPLRARALLPATLLLALAAAACGQAASSRPAGEPAPVRGGTVVLGSISDVDSWNPYLSQQAFASALLARVYLPLAVEGSRRAPDDFVPALAESWTFSPDRLVLTFRLREAAWSDGRPVTPADVVFTHRAQTSPDVPWPGAPTKESIAAVEAVGPREVAFRFQRPDPYQLADAVEGLILPEHVFGTVPFSAWTTHDWSAVRAASGPFVPHAHAPGHEIELARNPRYFRPQRPLVDRLVVRVVPDITSLQTQLLAGTLQYVEGITPHDAQRLTSSPDVGVLPIDRLGYDFIGWNTRRPPLDDPQVRRALTLAIDRQALVEELLYGMGRASAGPGPSAWWGADPGIAPWPHDREQARAVLAGRALSLELLTNAGNRVREQALLKIQQHLAEVGVTVRVLPLEMKAMRSRVAAGEFDGYLGGWVFSGKIDLASLFGSEALPPAGLNVVGYRSAEADRLLAEIEAAREIDALLPPLHAFQRRIHDDCPYTFLYEAQRVAAHARHLAGVTGDGPLDPLARLEEFWLRTP